MCVCFMHVVSLHRSSVFVCMLGVCERVCVCHLLPSNEVYKATSI